MARLAEPVNHNTQEWSWDNPRGRGFSQEDEEYDEVEAMLPLEKAWQLYWSRRIPLEEDEEHDEVEAMLAERQQNNYVELGRRHKAKFLNSLH
jgi:hypothetical protein